MTKDKFFKGLNAFGHDIYSPLTIFNQNFEKLKQKIKKDIDFYLLADRKNYFKFIDNICTEGAKMIESGNQVDVVESLVEKKLYFNHKQDSFVNDKLRERCERVASQILRVLEVNKLKNTGISILDVGCGSGYISKLLKTELLAKSVLLTDVVDYRYDDVISETNMQFEPFHYPFDRINSETRFDLCIIANVLHHSDTPFRVFKTALRSMKNNGIIVVVESCIGITPDMVNGTTYKMHNLPFQNVYDKEKGINTFMAEYLALTEIEKMLYGVFFDWLYNRVFLNENVNVPYNFGNPKEWNLFFTAECKLKSLNTYMMGLDQPSALEFHTIHLLKVIEPKQ